MSSLSLRKSRKGLAIEACHIIYELHNIRIYHIKIFHEFYTIDLLTEVEKCFITPAT